MALLALIVVHICLPREQTSTQACRHDGCTLDADERFQVTLLGRRHYFVLIRRGFLQSRLFLSQDTRSVLLQLANEVLAYDKRSIHGLELTNLLLLMLEVPFPNAFIALDLSEELSRMEVPIVVGICLLDNMLCKVHTLRAAHAPHEALERVARVLITHEGLPVGLLCDEGERCLIQFLSDAEPQFA